MKKQTLQFNRRRVAVWGALLVISLFNLGCSVFGARSEETPRSSVIEQEEQFEIRQYESYLVATTTVEGRYGEATNAAFRRLAGYIFGKNVSSQKIAMTAPVAMEPKSEKIAMTAPVMMEPKSEKIAMTAPVMMEPKSNDVLAEASAWEMSFMMPSQYKMEDLPVPQDPLVKIKEQPGRLMAVLRFTGLRDEAKIQEKTQELQSWLEKKGGYEAVGTPIFAGYDPPWTIPFLRRNEVMIEIRKK